MSRLSLVRKCMDWKILLVGFVALSVVSAGLVPAAWADTDEAIEHWGDIIQIILPATAGISTFFVGDPDGNRWDREGTRQFAYSFGFSWGTTRAGKILIEKSRPNSSNKSSFPSGHTNAAFSGAAFIGTRYGPLWGSFAYTGAAFVGYSRVHSSWHFIDDVVAGASIALLYNWYFVTPHHSRLAMFPAMVEGAPGVEMTVGLGDKAAADASTTLTAAGKDGFGFDFTFGPAFLIQNKVSTPGGDEFDLNDFDKNSDPITTASANVRYQHGKHQFSASYWPFESQDTGQFADPTVFGGATFPANEQITSSWRLHDLRASWNYRLIDTDRWHLRAGAGLLYQDTRVALSTQEATVQETVDDIVVLPFVKASGSYKFSQSVSLQGGGSFLSWPDDRLVDLYAGIGYRFSDDWEWLAGYYYYARDIKTDELRNVIDYSIPILSVRHSL
jgi:membrane-associated phospholipid phosphatase